MKRRHGLRWSTGALLLACAASAGVGVRAWEEDADRAWLRLKEQAESAADALAGALRAESAALANAPEAGAKTETPERPRGAESRPIAEAGDAAATSRRLAEGATGDDAVRFLARPDGVLLEPEWALDPRLAGAPAASTAGAAADVRAAPEDVAKVSPKVASADPVDAARRNAENLLLFDYYDAELLRAEREGGLDAAAEKAREFLERPQSGDVAAALLTASAALERRAGRTDAARAAWRLLADAHGASRDARGALRALAARLLLAETAPAETADAAELVALYEAAVDDAALAPEGAYIALLPRIAAAAKAASATASPALRDRLAAVARLDAGLRRARAFRSHWREGVATWIADGAPGGAKCFGVDEATPWIVSVVAAPNGAWRGGAREAESVLEAARRRPEAAAVASLGMTPLLGPATAEMRDVLVDRPLGAAWPPTWRLRIAGADLEALRATERRNFLLGALAVGSALLVAAAAAFATVRAVDREVRAADDREMFVAATTHELKTPLAAIKLLAELTPDPHLPPDRREEFARRIGAEADRLARLVTAVLDFARLERESPAEARARFRPVALGPLVRETADACRPVARRAGFDVRAETPAAGPWCAGDAEALRGALLNLLDNAIKYAGPPHEILVRAEVVAGRARLAVLDRGPGVPPAERERIFRPFVRSGNELVRERPGTGLGLALVARTATLHGGEALVRPRAEGGSEFALMLGPTIPGGGEAPQDAAS